DLGIGSGAAEDWSNKAYWNFGCAYQTAFAAQVADPRDLVSPQAETPADTDMRTRAGWTSWTRRMLVNAEGIVIVAAPDLASLRNTKILLDTLRAARTHDG